MAEINLVLTSRGGWRQAVKLTKPLALVGSDPRCDVVLDAARGLGAAARHLQLLSVPGQSALRLVNLADAVTVSGRQGLRSLAPRATLDLSDGDQIQVGEFTVSIGGAPGAAAPAVGREPARPGAASSIPPAAPAAPADVPAAQGAGQARGIGLELRFPNLPLEPEQSLDGVLLVRNLGDQAGVQFRITVHGLSPECCQVGPAPILFPNAQKEVSIRLRHPCGPSLPAGRQRFRVTVTAPDSYPGETAAVSHAVQVQPYYAHRVVVTPVE